MSKRNTAVAVGREPYITIEDEDNGNVWVWSRDDYPRGSVLEGQPRRQRLECFESVGDALDKYPNADVVEACSAYDNATGRDDFERMPAPDDFDPADAGEEW